MNTIETEIVNKVNAAVHKTLDDGLEEYLKANLFGWNGGLMCQLIKDKLASAINKNEMLIDMFKNSIAEVIEEPEFKVNLKDALRKRMVNELVKSFSLEGTFKELRNNPETRERLVAALEGIVA